MDPVGGKRTTRLGRCPQAADVTFELGERCSAETAQHLTCRALSTLDATVEVPLAVR